MRAHRAFAAGLSIAAAVSCSTQSASNAPAPAHPRVTTDAGILEGRADSGGRLLLFKGIPYAAPPVGDLRWKPPIAAIAWQGVRSAERLGHNCMQQRPYGDINPYTAGISEDCLNLNVTTQSTTGRRPVMVWIHGGGFFAGFGGEERHDGAVLASKGVVVVTINYRLGALGFLAHSALTRESPRRASGNYGLLDQVAALQWVQRNIANFGGDPSRVTIFGESAGGMSVGALIGSPLAKGLFRGAILESGAISNAFTRTADSAEALGARIVATLGVTGSDASAAARMRALSADSLMAATTRIAGNPGSPILWPTLDRYVLPQPVDSAIVRGTANVVPVIVGSNTDEPQSIFGAPSRAMVRLIAARGVPAYMYQFTRVAEDSINRKAGAYHSAEITFVFGRARPVSASAGHTSYDATLADAMSDYWVAFATSANPNGAPASGKWPAWPTFTSPSEQYIEFGPRIVAKRDLLRTLFDSLDVVARARGDIRP